MQPFFTEVIMIGSTVNRMIETVVVNSRRRRLKSEGLNSLLLGLFNNGHSKMECPYSGVVVVSHPSLRPECIMWEVSEEVMFRVTDPLSKAPHIEGETTTNRIQCIELLVWLVTRTTEPSAYISFAKHYWELWLKDLAVTLARKH